MREIFRERIATCKQKHCRADIKNAFLWMISVHAMLQQISIAPILYEIFARFRFEVALKISWHWRNLAS